MGCPHWCTKQLWAFIFTVFAGLFFVIAVASPWFVVAIKYDFDTEDGDGSWATTYWWKGRYDSIDITYSSTEIKSDGWTSWSDLDEASSKPKSTYMAAAAFAILSLVATIVVAFAFLFGLMIDSTRAFFERALCGLTKWWVAGIVFIAILFSIISWAVFISFPSALDDAGFCPQSYFLLTGTDDDLWCKSFIGTKKFDLGDTGISATAVWAPSIAWFFCLLGTIFAIVAFVLALFVKKHHNYDSL